ncbi:hypothetical protein DPMN_152239 [Dreissena polymorpha]|uniref:Uncharacterized protein n=1 Tax=Dreissena polymorpha TaxID=45954 RepID=A0A9D4FGV0_DREPO|nr:hypothetical protein DPMN_152239 [Dreissena polymorpha]
MNTFWLNVTSERIQYLRGLSECYIKPLSGHTDCSNFRRLSSHNVSTNFRYLSSHNDNTTSGTSVAHNRLH